MNEAKTPIRWTPGVADVLFLLIALAVMRGSAHTLLDDPGLGWHIRNIDAMLNEGGWLKRDPFTEPRGAEPAAWYTNQWLGELPYWVGWRWAGLEGIAAVNAVAIAALAGAMYRMMLADGLPWPVALGWTALGMMGTSCSWNARPNVFTLLFVLLTARACVLLHEGRLTRRASVAVVAMFAAWANTHGGFVAGLVMLVATLMIQVASRGRVVAALLLTASSFLATLVNPYGVELYRWVFQLLGDPFFMELHQEWRSPDFHSAGAMRYELLLLLFPLTLALTARRPNLVELGLSLMWLHFALTGFRYVAPWVCVATPLMARSFAAIPYLVDLAKRLELGSQPDSLFRTSPGQPSWAWSLLIGVALLGSSKALEGRVARHKQEIVASESVDRLIEIATEWRASHGRRPVICHDYDWGGYLTWHGWPRLLNWIDDRNEVQGRAQIEAYRDLMNAEPGWREALVGVDLVCVKPATPLAKRLGEDAAWTKRTATPFALIYERR